LAFAVTESLIVRCPSTPTKARACSSAFAYHSEQLAESASDGRAFGAVVRRGNSLGVLRRRLTLGLLPA